MEEKGIPQPPAGLGTEDLDRALNLIQTHYARPLPPQLLIEKALQNLCRSLGPYCDYLPPKKYKSLTQKVQGTFQGVGVKIRIFPGFLEILEVMPGSPGEKEGLKPGGRILAIQGHPISSLNPQDIPYAFSSTFSTVSLTLADPRGPRHVDLPKGKVDLPSVQFSQEGQVGYLKITSFNNQTPDLCLKALESFQISSVKGIVLDLRGNKGGLLTAGVRLANFFIKEGALVVGKGAKGKRGVTYRCCQEEPYYDFGSVVLLIDRHTASAAEVLASALQDYKKAIILGEPSFGKGSIQKIFPLGPNRGALKLTTSLLYRPSGAPLNEKGVVPHIRWEKDSIALGSLDWQALPWSFSFCQTLWEAMGPSRQGPDPILTFGKELISQQPSSEQPFKDPAPSSLESAQAPNKV